MSKKTWVVFCFSIFCVYFLGFFPISFTYYIVLISTFGVFNLTSVLFDYLPQSSGGSEQVTGCGLMVSGDQPTIDKIISLSVCPALRNHSGLNPDTTQYPQAQNGTGLCDLGTLHKTARMKKLQVALYEFAGHTPEYANTCS